MEKLSERLYSWATIIDPNTEDQARKLSKVPFIHDHVALMADAHLGKGATVGSVIATDGAVLPAAVGVDLGCGMIAVETELTSAHLPDNLDRLHAEIMRSIPTGAGHGHGTVRRVAGNIYDEKYSKRGLVPRSDSEIWDQKGKHGDTVDSKALSQLGSLGGGNHFIELCLDESDGVWLVLHSGSRGPGNLLAQWHIKKARGLMKAADVKLEDADLAYLTEGTPEFDAYITDMLWAQQWALDNRHVMMEEFKNQLSRFLGFTFATPNTIQCHHNYCTRETHDDTELWVTRKGAILADENVYGVIPGSMGDASFIVRGLGNPESFNSASHGAGRKMSRAAAKRDLDNDTFIKSMEGIAWNGDASLIDEDPRSYKPIRDVMDAQSDLVEIVHELHQILNVKGHG